MKLNKQVVLALLFSADLSRCFKLGSEVKHGSALQEEHVRKFITRPHEVMNVKNKRNGKLLDEDNDEDMETDLNEANDADEDSVALASADEG